jgi:hypothetical protein
MESKGRAAAFLQIQKRTCLGKRSAPRVQLRLGCKLNPREYIVVEYFGVYVSERA